MKLWRANVRVGRLTKLRVSPLLYGFASLKDTDIKLSLAERRVDSRNLSAPKAAVLFVLLFVVNRNKDAIAEIYGRRMATPQVVQGDCVLLPTDKVMRRYDDVFDIDRRLVSIVIRMRMSHEVNSDRCRQGNDSIAS